ncbi:hypothetical protein [Methylotuvimicrobium buryatense]|uniref:Uncharacterized protein n=1 Tax=Methylotuvimicrobium buryatense TaxID=95641 RepID=A0A4P9UPV0_METBY|nr:hypothetical protein [Methylotuvimicrobium buryatense]QCW81596.1 hypothetical protein EQU24_04535 [Methylotuvimicrobium buryatense]
MPDCYPVVSPKIVDIGRQRLLLDCHGGDEYRKISCSLFDESLICDRLLLNPNDGSVVYLGAPNQNRPLQRLGKPADVNWLQCRYNWRYRVHRDGWFYWLYEEVILNVALTEVLKETIFIDTLPSLVFDDFTLGRLEK